MNISHRFVRAQRALSFLPCRFQTEIVGICRSRDGGLGQIREIRLRHSAKCTINYKNEHLVLQNRLSQNEARDMLDRLSRGSLYAYRDNIINGYIPIGEGIRVGVCGRLSYENGSAVGVSDVSSFVFRIPTGECAFSSELLSVYRERGLSGLLIYSPPGVGKTTALRSLARGLGSGRCASRVCVIDERCEFDGEDYFDCEVDILSGYKKRDGIEIAARTMSPGVIMVDEIGPGEAPALSDVVRCGVPIVATAHARSVEELYSRAEIASLLELGAFGTLVGISYRGGHYAISVDGV